VSKATRVTVQALYNHSLPHKSREINTVLTLVVLSVFVLL